MRGGKRPIPEGAPGHPYTSSRNAGGPVGRGPGSLGRGPKGRRGENSAWERSAGEERPRKGPAADPQARARARPAGRPSAKLVYEDEELLAYDKGPGLPVIAPDGSRGRSLLDMATEQVRRRNPKGRAAVVHRLDRDTSGIVIFAKSALVKKELMGNWDELVSERLYVALVEGEMGSDSGKLDSWLKEDDAGRVRAAASGARGAKRAITRWRLLKSGGGLSLLELSLETGRKHQIRVQLAEAGHPVLGDPRYGSRRDDAERLCLHAIAIELKRPGRANLRIESPAPEEFWEALRRAVKNDERRPGEQEKRPPRKSFPDGPSKKKRA